MKGMISKATGALNCYFDEMEHLKERRDVIVTGNVNIDLAEFMADRGNFTTGTDYYNNTTGADNNLHNDEIYDPNIASEPELSDDDYDSDSYEMSSNIDEIENENGFSIPLFENLEDIRVDALMEVNPLQTWKDHFSENAELKYLFQYGLISLTLGRAITQVDTEKAFSFSKSILGNRFNINSETIDQYFTAGMFLKKNLVTNNSKGRLEENYNPQNFVNLIRIYYLKEIKNNPEKMKKYKANLN